MTTTDTLTDTELDAWLADRLFGLASPPAMPFSESWLKTGPNLNGPEKHEVVLFRPYSSTGDGMLLVLEAMRERGWDCSLYYGDVPSAEFYPSTGNGSSPGWVTYSVTDEALPRATAWAARAALEASRTA